MENRVFDGTLEFTHISRPTVTQQYVEGLGQGPPVGDQRRGANCARLQQVKRLLPHVWAAQRAPDRDIVHHQRVQVDLFASGADDGDGLADGDDGALLEATAPDLGPGSAIHAELYRRRGETELANAYLKKVINHRKQNPYYRYHLAREAFFSGDYATAISHLRYAARKKPNEDLFCFLLGIAYLQSGDKAAARRWLTRAEEVAASDALKRRYSSKIDLLLSPSD